MNVKMKKRKGPQMFARTYLVKRIGRDYYIYGSSVQLNKDKLMVIPKFVFYKEKELIKHIEGNKEFTLIKYNKNSFGYSEEEETDQEIRGEIERVELVTDYNEVIESIKAKYERRKNIRISQKEGKRRSFELESRRDFLILAILAIAIALFFNYFMGICEVRDFIIIITLFIVINHIGRTLLEKRHMIFDGTVDEILVNEEYEDRIVASYSNVLRIFWKNWAPTIHLLIDRDGYEKWVKHMKEFNKDSFKKEKLADKFKKLFRRKKA